MEEMESVCFKIISNAGTARSLIIEALYEARENNFSEAESKMNEAKTYFEKAHITHAKLIQQEAAGNSVPFSLLFMHAEDQLMSAETIKHLSNELIHMYKKMQN